MRKNTSMREAFLSIKVDAGIVERNGSVLKAAIKAAEHGSGVRNERDWNAHLKFGTYNRLVKNGVMQ